MNQTLIRALLKIGGGFLIAKGLADDNQVETIIAGLCAAFGIVWGLWHRTQPPDDSAGAVMVNYSPGDPTESPPARPTLRPTLLLAVLGLSVFLFYGCAFNRQYATTTATNPTNGVVNVTIARSTTYALGDAKTIIDKTRASAGKTSSVGASGIDETSSTPNFATNAGAMLELIRALK